MFQVSAYKPPVRYGLVALALFAAAALQTLHFYFYYDQEAARAIVWSAVDWASWFLVIGLIHQTFGKFSGAIRKRDYWVFVLAVVVVSGPLQIILSNFLNGLAFAPDRPFLEDILHLYDKRWLQNLLYAGLLWQFFELLWPVRKTQAEGRSKTGGKPKPLKISDGKTIHRVEPDRISFAEAAGNYVLIHLEDRDIMTRESLKEFLARLPENAFVRISRSHLVNREKIARIEPYSKYSKQIVLKNGKTLKIGRTYLARVGPTLIP